MCCIVKAAFRLRKGSFFYIETMQGKLEKIKISKVLIKKMKYGG
ncbi:hypothetical protein NT98_3090 [Bacillus cereus]|nr:hypothetical protein NT98_3090 [Bacillus cereus]AJI07319.1 hypothetical protein AQ16_46 [Bacillus cereus G9241]EAL12951.1 hypothetical protein protein [Bacillus cereus G9241]